MSLSKMGRQQKIEITFISDKSITLIDLKLG